MNKRQIKKRNKKRLPVIADEVNLITMNDEEYKNAVESYKDFVRRYTYRKKYINLKGKYLVYFFPLGERDKKFMEDMVKSCRKIKTSNILMVEQNIDDIN